MGEIFRDKVKKKQFIYSYAIFVINGMLALSIGTLMPLIREARGLNYAFVGLLVSLHSVGNLFSSFMGGILPVFVGRKRSILIFNAFFALSFLLILLGDSRWVLILAFIMTGFARGATSNFGNLVINDLAPGKAAALNGLHAMFAVGAFTFPLLLTAMTHSNPDQWIYAVIFMMIMGVLSWLLYFIFPMEREKMEKKEKGERDTGFFREPLFYLCTLTLFFYLCAEQGVIGWMVTYFTDSGLLDGNLPQIMSSILWVMILIGRLSTAFLSTKVKRENLLLGMGIGLVAFFLVLISGRTTGVIVVGIIGFGLSMAGIYATTVSFAGHIIRKYPISWSFILTGASLGAIIMPVVIGGIAETAGIIYGMSSVAVVLIIDFALIIALKFYIKKKPNA